jgi:hypothetical protein
VAAGTAGAVRRGEGTCRAPGVTSLEQQRAMLVYHGNRTSRLHTSAYARWPDRVSPRREL